MAPWGIRFASRNSHQAFGITTKRSLKLKYKKEADILANFMLQVQIYDDSRPPRPWKATNRFWSYLVVASLEPSENLP